MKAKKILLIISIFFTPFSPIFGDENFNEKDSSNHFGFYASASVYRSTYKGELAGFTNLSAGTIINDAYTLAVVYKNKHNSSLNNSYQLGSSKNQLPYIENYNIGLQIGISQKIHKAVNMNFGAIFSQGNASLYELVMDNTGTFGSTQLTNKSKYSVFEPYLGIEFIPNISWIRLELMTSYNLIFGLSIPYHTKADLSGPSVSFAFKFGIY